MSAATHAVTPGGTPNDDRRTPRGVLRAAAAHPLLWPALALLALVVVNVVATPSFLEVRVLDGRLYGTSVDIVRNSAPVLLVALGMTLVIATRGIDLSVGAVAAIAGAVACTWIAGSPEEGAVATAITAGTLALAVCLLLGVWNGFLVSVVGIQPIIATLVLMTAGRGVAMLVTDGQITTVNNDAFRRLGAGFVLGVPLAALVALVLVVLTSLLTRRTALGMLIEAVGTNPVAARLAGVRARTITWTVYVFAAGLAGLAGLMIASNTSAADANNAGLWIELDAILAVVIGGTSLAGGRFSLAGTVLGALFITTLSVTVTNVGIPSETNYLFKAVAVIAVCLLQSPKARAALRVRRTPPRPAVPSDAAGPAPVAPSGRSAAPTREKAVVA